MNIFIKVGLVTTVVFLTGIFFGLYIGEEKVSALETTIINLDESINNAELQFLFFDVMGANTSCQYLTKQADNLGEEASVLGSEVERFENSRKLSETAFNALKRKYTSVLIRDWLMIEKIKDTCNQSYITVLYFYSNKECDDCKNQGMILSILKAKLDQDFLVFSIDSDMELQIVEMLKDAYGVEQYPTLVMNEEILPGFVDIDELKQMICDYNSELEICEE